MSDHSTDDVIDELATDHREFLDLLDQVQATTDPATRRDAADRLIAEVVRHAVAEEIFVYPVMRDHVPNGEQKVSDDTSEHKQIERTMKQLERADASSPQFLEHVRSLRMLLEEHIADEEAMQFPQMRAHVPAERLLELKGKVETAKKSAPTRPHPLSPNAELFHKTVGPGVGLVDRLRDKLTGRPT